MLVSPGEYAMAYAMELGACIVSDRVLVSNCRRHTRHRAWNHWFMGEATVGTVGPLLDPKPVFWYLRGVILAPLGSI